MKIALVQTNPIIGDFAGNSARILARTREARERGCRLAIFPELSLCGYPPQDLLERADFIAAHDRALNHLLPGTGDIGVVLGVIERRTGSGKPLYNTALLADNGREIARSRKRLLPTYDVFDETRYFEPGDRSVVAPFAGLRLGLTVCEDIWFEEERYGVDPVAAMQADKPDCLINISASPYYHGKLGERQAVFSALCRRHRLPLLYANQVGGQDSLIFDGHSLVLTPEGEVGGCAPGFAEHLLVVESGTWGTEEEQSVPVDATATVLAALTLGVRDYLHKSGFSTAVLGVSGGIDSAVTAAIACRALGPENVLAVALPSPFTSAASIEDARLLAANLGCPFKVVPITPAMHAYRETLAPLFAGLAEDVTEQNIQARIRGNILMALSNKFGRLLLSTGNKSELAVGYCTLYGDMSGGLSVLADVPKQMVYGLALEINRERAIIPARSISRPPTAELKPGQCDQDDLPPYETLDPILQAYLEERLSVDEIAARGFDRAVVADLVRRIATNEYKRRQAALGLKVTSKAFGHGRRYPLVQKFRS
ncbi:MAG TPA: NAD+ synthase [Desulfobulbaceae bacterium]|nr:NAD+ synthase [Desulfobulbaceae bacterium]